MQASSNTATRPPSPKTTQQGKLHIEAKQQCGKTPQRGSGTNVHSAYAGISVHNALLNLGPPRLDAKIGSKHLPWLRLTDWEMMNLRKRMKKNAKWRPSDEMIKKELGEIGRGPHDYARAKEEAMIYGVGFLDEDSAENQGSHRKTSMSDQPFLGPNLGMKLNQAKKRKREAHVPAPEGTTFERSVPVQAATRQRLCGSDVTTNGRRTIEEPKPDRAYEGVDWVSAGEANNEGVQPNRKLAMLKLYMPSVKVIEPIVGRGEEREKLEAKLDDVKGAAGRNPRNPGADLYKAGKATTVGSGVRSAAPVGRGPTKPGSSMKCTLAANPPPALVADANTVVPIDLTDMSTTDSDASSATSTEGHEMLASPSSQDESPSSESSAESSLGDVSLPPPETHSLDEPSIFYGLGLDSSKMVVGADTGLFPGGDQSLVATSATSTDNLSPGKLGSMKASSSPRRDKHREQGHAYIPKPKDDRRAFLVNPAMTNTVSHGHMSSRTPLDRQAREIVLAAVTRSIKLGDPTLNNAVKNVDEKSPTNPTSVFVPPSTRHGNAHGSKNSQPATSRLHCLCEDEATSNPTSAGNENVYATTSTIIKPETTAMDTSRLPETNNSVGPKKVFTTQPLLHGSISSCVSDDQSKLKQAVETTVARSKELGDIVFGHAVQQLYKQSLSNPMIADLLVAVLIQEPLPAQSTDFAHRIQVARNKYLMSQFHRNVSFWSILGSPSILTTAPVLPLRTTSAFSKDQSHFTSKPANPHPIMKLRSASHTDVPRGVVGSTVVAGPKFPPLTSTATSIAPSTAISEPRNGRSPFTDKITNQPTPLKFPSPSKPRAPIGVPGGSGVMAFNRARRRARISAGGDGSHAAMQQARTPDGPGKHSAISPNERHQRLREFVVHGKVT